VMLLVEMLLVVQEVPLPSWFLPDITPNDIITVMHRLYPAFMNGCRCITGAFYVDRKAQRVAALEAVLNSTKDMASRLSSVSHALTRRAEEAEEDFETETGTVEDEDWIEDDGTEGAAVDADRTAPEGGTGQRHTKTTAVSKPTRLRKETVPAVGIMAKGLAEVRRRLATSPEGRSGAHNAAMEARVKLIADPAALKSRADGTGGLGVGLTLLRDVCVYLLARYLIVRTKKV
jgi:hypothetical protein